MALNKELAHHWCEELADNLIGFRKKTRLKPESKLNFIVDQYASLFSLARINRDDAIMKGIPHRMFKKQQEDSPPIQEE